MSSPHIIAASLAARAAEWYFVSIARAAHDLARRAAKWRVENVDKSVDDLQELERAADRIRQKALDLGRDYKRHLRDAQDGAKWQFDDDEPDGVPWWKGPEQ